MKSLLLTFLVFPSFLLAYFDGPYEQWRNARIQAIEEFYGEEFFRGKTVLEIGCGYGDIGGHFEKLGATVTCSDSQAEYESVVHARYPNVEFRVADLQGPWTLDDHYDVIIHMGVLNRTQNPAYSIAQACQHCDYLILEADCINSFDPNSIQYRQLSGYDYSSNLGSFVSPAYIERCLNDFGFMRWMIPDGRCNGGYWYYDSPLTNTGAYNIPGYRRMWFSQRCDLRKNESEYVIINADDLL